MLTHPTRDRLVELGLHGMAKAFDDMAIQPEARALEHGDWLALLLDHEATQRRQKRFESRARAARLRHAASVEDVDYRAIARRGCSPIWRWPAASDATPECCRLWPRSSC